MLGIVVAFGFVGMVLAPSAVAVYGRLGKSLEGKETASPLIAPEEPALPVASTVDVITNDRHTRRPVPLSTSPLAQVTLQPVPTLRQVAEQAVRQARQAQAEAAQAHLEALQEVSRAASKRAHAAAKLADAAERELIRAAQASAQAEAAKQRAKAGQGVSVERDYLPHDHPSLDFPRSRVPSRRVA